MQVICMKTADAFKAISQNESLQKKKSDFNFRILEEKSQFSTKKKF